MARKRRSAGPWRTFLALVLTSGGPSSLLAANPLEQAQKHLEQGDQKAAVIELKDALQKTPGDVAVRLLLGGIYLQQKNGVAAETTFERAIELGANREELRLDLAEAQLLQKRFSDTLDGLSGVRDLPSDIQAKAFTLRGEAHLGLSQMEKAARDFRLALARDPGQDRARLGGIRIALAKQDRDAALEATDQLLARSPRNLDALLIRAAFHSENGELESAADLFERGVAVDGDDLRAVIGHALTMIARGDLIAAKADLARIDGIRPNTPTAHYLRGLIAYREEDWGQSKEHLERMLAAAPDHVQSQLLMGAISYRERNLERAEEYLSRALATLPSNTLVVKMLAATRIRLGGPEHAIGLLEPALRRVSDAQMMAMLGGAYIASGDHAKGEEWLRRAVETAPDQAGLRMKLALIQLAIGETDRAIGELQAAVDLGQDILQADVLLVLAHLKGQRFEEALTAASALEERIPENPIPYNLKGLAFLAQGDIEPAVERFNRALKLDPKFIPAQLNLARAAAAAGDLDAAERNAEQILDQQPDHLQAMLGLAEIAERRGEVQASLSWLTKARNAHPNALQPGLLLTRYHLRKAESLNALAIANELFERFPRDERVLELLARAQTLTGKATSAIRTIEQLAQQQPESPRIQYLKGTIKHTAGDLDGAREAFLAAIALEPKLPKTRIALASVEVQSGRIVEALAVTKRLQQEFPQDAAGYRIEGSIYLKLDRPDKAIPALVRSYELKAERSAAHQLAQAYMQTDQPDQAIATLRGWLTKDPGDPVAEALLASIYATAGRDLDAIALYEKLNRAVPGNASILNNLAWLYERNGDARAREMAKAAFDIDPEQVDIADTYGWILVNNGEAGTGLGILQRAYASAPTRTAIGYRTAVALSLVGRNEEAAKLLKRLLREDPGFEQAEDARALLAKLGG